MSNYTVVANWLKPRTKPPGPLNEHIFRKMDLAQGNMLKHFKRRVKHRRWRRFRYWSREFRKQCNRLITLP